MIVLKFGGTSVGTSRNLLTVKHIVESQQEPAVVVVSALGGLTDKLIATARLAAAADAAYQTEHSAIAERHYNIIREVISAERQPDTLAKIEPLLQELRRLYDGVSLIADLPERTLCQIVSLGERMSSVIVADMIRGASFHNSLDFIKTEKWFDRDIASAQLCDRLIREEFTPDTQWPAVCGGFISTDSHSGEITNLGRGGSVFTAAMIAAALDAESLQIWTDVDGFLTTDPRIVPEAKVIPEMSFVESMDLCTFGAKVIYPPTIYPVFHKNIPIRILNTFHPEAPGTLIKDGNTLCGGAERSHVAGISALRDVCLATLRGTFPQQEPRLIHTRAVNALARRGISILLVARSTEPNAFSFAIAGKDAPSALRMLKEEFAPELFDGTVEVIESTTGLATIAVVGDGIAKIPDISATLLAIFASKGIEVKALSDRASQTALSFVISEEVVAQAVTALHARLFTD